MSDTLTGYGVVIMHTGAYNQHNSKGECQLHLENTKRVRWYSEFTVPNRKPRQNNDKTKTTICLLIIASMAYLLQRISVSIRSPRQTQRDNTHKVEKTVHECATKRKDRHCSRHRKTNATPADVESIVPNPKHRSTEQYFARTNMTKQNGMIHNIDKSLLTLLMLRTF